MTKMSAIPAGRRDCMPCPRMSERMTSMSQRAAMKNQMEERRISFAA